MLKSNFEIDDAKNKVTLFLNPSIFPLSCVKKTTELFSERAWATLDGDGKHEILVELTPKKSFDLETLAREFNEALLRTSIEELPPIDKTSSLLSRIKKVTDEFIQEQHGSITKSLSH